MKLSDYLILHHLSPASFAKRVGLRSRTTIHRYIKGERCLVLEIARRIEIATRGAVAAKYFNPDSHVSDSVTSFLWVRQ